MVSIIDHSHTMTDSYDATTVSPSKDGRLIMTLLPVFLHLNIYCWQTGRWQTHIFSYLNDARLGYTI